MLKFLSANQVTRYQTQGYLSGIPVLNDNEIAEFRGAFLEHATRIRGKFSQQYKHKTHLMLQWADRMVNHPKVLDIVEDLLGPNVLCWTSNLFQKKPMQPQFVSWHQDSTYWGLEPDEVLTVWIALMPSTPESGCLKVIPGSHHWTPVIHEDTFDKNNQLTRGQSMVGVDENLARDVVLAPGEISIHHVRLAHASRPNKADHARLGFAIRFMSANVRAVGRNESALLVRGRDLNGHFAHEQRPSGDFAMDGRLAHNRALRLQVGNIYRLLGNESRGDSFRLGIQKSLSHLVLDTLYAKLRVQSLFQLRAGPPL
jgi:chlorinating enzyme